MGYLIQPVQIWTNGTAAEGNYIDASIVSDNLHDRAQFYWQISNITTDEQGNENKQTLTQGNSTIAGAEYTIWGEQADVNFAAYQYICSQLNLTLIA